MRYTVPWLPAPREPLDDDELSGKMISLSLIVGIIVRRYGEPVSDEVLCIAMAGLFGAALDRLSDDQLVGVISGSVLLARTLGLIEMTPNGSFQAPAIMQPWRDEA